MAQTRLNRKGKVVPKNANQRKQQTKKPSKSFNKESQHGTKKHPRHW